MSNLEEKAHIQEVPFESSWPLVAKFRSAWNNVAARWYVLGMFYQQIDFNVSLVEEFAILSSRLSLRMASQDKDLVGLTKTVAELELQVKQLAQRVQELESEE